MRAYGHTSESCNLRVQGGGMVSPAQDFAYGRAQEADRHERHGEIETAVLA